MLTEGAVRASDKRAQFVGVEAYEQAGGVVLRDLFQQDDGGWLQDPALLDRLVAERLAREAEPVVAEGWKWVEVAADFPYGHTYGLRRVSGEAPVLTDNEQAACEALSEEMDHLYAEHEGEDLSETADARLSEIETALEALQNRPMRYDPAEVARAGAFVSIDGSGGLRLERGFVRPEDEAPVIKPEVQACGDGEGPTATSSSEGTGSIPPVQHAVIDVGGGPECEPTDEDEGVKPFPERLLMELTAHRTLALREALANSPHVAMTALLHKLATDTFHRVSTSGGCLEVSVRHVFFPAQPDELKDSASARAVDERQKAWAVDLPLGDDQALWGYLDKLDEASRSALLAYCVSFGVNALVEKVDRYGGSGLSQHGLDRRLAQADWLASAVGLDMAEAGWRPTAANYLGRVTKGRILEAVREAKGDQAAQLIDHLKKGDMAKEAERLLADTGWLPEPLRTPGVDDAPTDVETAADEDRPEALPAFLAEEVQAEAEHDPEPHSIAAE